MKRFHFDWLLCNLRQVDMQELVDHGAMAARDHAAWGNFCGDRIGWYLAAPRPVAHAAFRAILAHKSGNAQARDVLRSAPLLPFPKKRDN